MRAINHIYAWGGNDKQYCWSGTPFGLMSGLQECVYSGKINQVKDLSLEIPKRKSVIRKIHSAFNKALKRNDFQVYRLRCEEDSLRALRLEDGNPCLVYGEYLNQYTKNCYIYQDLTVDFLIRLKETNPEQLIYNKALSLQTTSAAMAFRRQHAKEFYKECKGIFTMSDWLAEDLIKNMGIPTEKVHAIGAGVNIDITKMERLKKNGKRFLFIGKDWKRKNGPLVVEGFMHLLKSEPDAELYIAGPANRPLEINDCSQIHFLGWLFREELIEYYNLCDYFVMPSHFEAYGIVFGEVLSFGLPCIGRNAYAMPEFITHGYNGYLLENEDAEELGRCMLNLIRHKEIVENVAKNQINYVSRYSWKAVAERVVAVMEADGAWN